MDKNSIIKKVAGFINERNLLRSGDRVLLSVSAGKDSMAMLHLLHDLEDEMGITLGLFHLNHMIRGEESDRDERFVADKAQSMGLPMFARQYDFIKDKSKKLSLEEHARDIRYGLLREIAVTHGYSKIATAHTRTDDAETMLMRLFTGTGIHGLTGIAAIRGNIIRPLLALSSEEVYRFLVDSGIPWREDSSNREGGYSRNRVRNDIIPAVRKHFPKYEDAMAGTKRIAEEAMELLDNLIRSGYGIVHRRHNDSVVVKTEGIEDNAPLLRHILASCIRTEFAMHPTRGMLDEIVRRCKPSRTHCTLYESPSIRISKHGANIILTTGAGASVPASWEHAIHCNDGEPQRVHCPEISLVLSLRFVEISIYNNFRKNRDIVFIDPGETAKRIVIRNRRKGDRIVLDIGTKKIKDFFIEKKLDNVSKERVPLLIVDDCVAAIMTGFLYDIPNRVSSSYLVTEHTKKVLAITLENHYTMDMENSRS